MSNIIKVLEDGQLVVTSRQIAKDFNKEHKHVLEAIRNLVAENSAVKNMIIESSYENRGKQYPEYLLTRDGFSLLVMGFTGARALEWKLKYIEAFNKMEQALKEQQKPACIEDVLIQSLQEMKEVKYQIAAVKQESKEVKEEVQAIKDIIVINPKEEWRKQTNNILNQIGFKTKEYKKVKDEAYKALEDRAKCKLKIRLENLQGRALREGMAPSKVSQLNNLDVIANDVRLKEIYINIVKEMAIKNGVKVQEVV